MKLIIIGVEVDVARTLSAILVGYDLVKMGSSAKVFSR